ncbi:amino acid permease [Thermoactinomyces sp. AMNI-1]|uniref:Amino acid permease n=1 Tax=Thermoactinomyces mirandus TaxID=2756294 RepID=A0A7W2AQ22_9BACL|nr:amino acid permease [Thermoactinomyces mirandus]
MPIWLLSTLFTLLAMGINLIGMKNYGKVEMFFAWIKIVALLLFIGLIAGMIWAGETQPNGSIVNRGDWFVQGAAGFLTSLSLMFFTFGGIIATGMASAEVADVRVIPRAFNRLIMLLGSLYLFGLLAVLSVNSFAVIVPAQSPFVITLSRINIPYSDHVLNAVMISAAFSTMTAAMFGVSRILVTLSERGEAPRRLCCENGRGVPIRSLFVTVAALSISILASVFLSKEIYEYLTTSAGVILMFLWTLIIFAHGGFVRAQSGLTRTRYAWQKTASITVMAIAVLGILLHPSRWVSLLI